MKRLTLADSHAHLDFQRFSGDLVEVIERARLAGVEIIVAIGAGRGYESNPGALAVASQYDWIRSTVGIHPHDASLMTDGILDDLRRLAETSDRIVAVGETGLDYHYDRSPRPAQREAFRKMVKLARELSRPLIIHTREAEQDTVDILTDEGATDCGGVIHCFSGTTWLAEKALDLGFYLSFSGIVTFPDAGVVREVAAAAPADRILVETDCPYLAPVPRRGRRNEPAFVEHTLRFIAGLRNHDPVELSRVTLENTRRLFRLTGPC